MLALHLMVKIEFFSEKYKDLAYLLIKNARCAWGRSVGMKGDP